MKLKNAGLPVGEIVDVSAEHAEYLLKLFGKKFVVVAELEVDVQNLSTSADVPGQVAVASEPDKPRVRGKVR